MPNHWKGPEEEQVRLEVRRLQERWSRAEECVGIACEEASPGWFSLKAYLWMKVQQPWGPLAQKDEASD